MEENVWRRHVWRRPCRDHASVFCVKSHIDIYRASGQHCIFIYIGEVVGAPSPRTGSREGAATLSAGTGAATLSADCDHKSTSALRLGCAADTATATKDAT